MSAATYWRCREHRIDLSEPVIMGIVNVTPDSFSDGGTHASRQKAVRWGLRLAQEGAQILDVGGESTRPGAALVSLDEELERVVGVVEDLVQAGCIVSVDTSKAEVMREALRAGAHILNDIRSFTEPGALQVASDSDAGLVIMHMQGNPQTMQQAPVYDDVVSQVQSYLQARDQALVQAGVVADRICWDPGFGFGKTVEHNFALLAATDRFVAQGRVYLMGLSRKSAIGAVTHVTEPAQRDAGSIAGALIAVQQGAQIVRVHDVAGTRQALDVWRAVQNA